MKDSPLNFGSFRLGRNGPQVKTQLRREIAPDVCIFKLKPQGFVVVYFDASGQQVSETVEDGNGLVSLLRSALSC